MRPIVALVLVTTFAWAQHPPLSGTVKDREGVIAGVSIALKTPDGTNDLAQRQVTTTDAQGCYRFDRVTKGTWLLEFARDGFNSETRTVAIGDAPVELDVELTPQGVSTILDVTDLAGKATASRLEIPDRELPAQVSSVTSETLESQGVNDLATALRNASGVSARVQYGVYEYYSMRGFNSSAVVLVDGMRMEGNRTNTQLNNVEQVDVLKGPSSVLYGGQALSGVINIVRKKPQALPDYNVSYRAGRFGLNQVGVGATGSMGNWNRLLYRIDSMFENNDGWRGAGSRRFNVSPTLTWLITDRARVTFFQGFTRDHFNLDGGLPTALYNTAGFDKSTRFNTVQDFELSREWQNQVFFNANLTNWLEVRNSFFYNRKGDQYYNAESLSYVSSLNQVNRTALYFYHHRRPVQNQSDVIGRAAFLGTKHWFLAGYEYQDFFTASDRAAGRSVALPPLKLPALIDTYQPVPDFPLTSVDNSSLLSKAFYWQDQIALTRRIKLNIGGRFTDYVRRAHSDPYANGSFTRGADTSRHAQSYTYRAGIVYSLTEAQQLYFSSNSSFTPVTTIPADGRELLPEKGRSYEVGHRWQALGGRLQFNTSLYKLIRENVVVTLGNGLYDQAGQQSSKGVDFDVNGRLGRGFHVVGSYGYSMPRYDSYFASNGTVNLSGRMPNYTTRHTANVWITRQWKAGFHASMGTRYMGRVFLNDTNTSSLGGWTTFNGSFGFRRSFYDWSVNAENLLNRERYVTATLSSGNQVYPGAPINIFTTIRLRWK